MLTFMFPQFSAIKIFSFIFVFFPHFIIKLISKLLQKPLNYKLLNLYTEAMKKILILLRKFSFEQLRSYLIFVHIKIHVSITYVYVFTIICNLYIEKKKQRQKANVLTSFSSFWYSRILSTVIALSIDTKNPGFKAVEDSTNIAIFL